MRARPLVMGVLILTPDSFSDGGLWLEPDTAIAHAEEMIAEGADLLDLGAESTRPGGGVYGEGAPEVSVAQELDRLIPVVEALRSRSRIPLSVDTRKARVAEAALRAGAGFINDVSALSDPGMAEVASRADCSIVLMHSRGVLRDMQRKISFDRVVEEVVTELDQVVARATSSGLRRDRLILDPGIGYGKRPEHNLSLFRHLDRLQSLGCPLLVGASRKSFIGEITGAEVEDRLAGSLATVGWAARHGAAIVRVHDVAATVQFLDLWSAIETADTDARVDT